MFQVPMEYNHLQEIPIIALRNRLLLLHHISELFCPCIPMFDLEGSLDETGLGPSVGFDTLRGILISQGKVLCSSLWTGSFTHNKFYSGTIDINFISFSKWSLSVSYMPASSKYLEHMFFFFKKKKNTSHVLCGFVGLPDLEGWSSIPLTLEGES